MLAMAKAAILIDGAYFLKRLPGVRRDIDVSNPEEVVKAIEQLVKNHLEQINEIYNYSNPFQILYRSFYYDALPYADKTHTPMSKKAVNYAKSDVAVFREKLFGALRKRPNFALRLGKVIKLGDKSWVLNPEPQKRLLNGDMEVSQLTDSDFSLNLRQKGVDMRIGLDIATLSLKKQANIIVLVAGDSDFVQAAILARREGVTFILDPLSRNISPDLSEHVDRLTNGFAKPQNGSPTAETED